ncbi:universal stress protein [Salinisphaera sp. SPP-AMP-43]|uniref:universal stress protein n=1 Tax=Salinisphaera sp. SPP-AMP-43 TaxID=3121288 RepID=UPI003C6DF69E
MDYTTILLHVQDDSHQAAVTAAAAGLALRWQAHLTGLHTHVPTYHGYVASGSYPVAVSPEMIENDESEAAEHDQTLDAAFVRQLERRGVTDYDWQYRCAELADQTTADLLTAAARNADLVIMGQHDAEDDDDHVSFETPAVVALGATRPVLVLPREYGFDTIGRRIVIGWNASREAARAVTAALPFLRDAETVELLVVEDDSAADHAHGAEPGADIALYLARHDIDVQVMRRSRGRRDVADVLLEQVAESGADLLCLGAYGHSRLRELAFGGVTYSMLRQATVPMLLAC